MNSCGRKTWRKTGLVEEVSNFPNITQELVKTYNLELGDIKSAECESLRIS